MTVPHDVGLCICHGKWVEKRSQEDEEMCFKGGGRIIRDGSVAGRVIDSEKQTVANLRSERPFNMEWRLHSCAPV